MIAFEFWGSEERKIKVVYTSFILVANLGGLSF